MALFLALCFTPGIGSPLLFSQSTDEFGSDLALDTFVFSPSIRGLLLQPDGAVVFGGVMSVYGSSLARLTPSGEIDGTFFGSMETSSSRRPPVLTSLARESDGGMVLCGYFDSLDDYYMGPASWVSMTARLQSDGRFRELLAPEYGPDPSLVMPMPDGRILLVNSTWDSEQQVVRLHRDGSLETAFQVPKLASGSRVVTLAPLLDGSIFVGGTLRRTPPTALGNLLRFRADGSLDDSFSSDTDGPVLALLRLPDGGVLVGGTFRHCGGIRAVGLARLRPNGEVDTEFQAPDVATVTCLALQSDGKILVGGAFESVAGQPSTNLCRLHSDGRLDTGFVAAVAGSQEGGVPYYNDGGITNAPPFVRVVGVQTDGAILIGGEFSLLNGEARSSFGRLRNPDPAIESFTRDGTTLRWMRSGAGPEIVRASFSALDSEGAWKPLGEGIRIEGGWEFTAATLAENAVVRAQGEVCATPATGATEIQLGPLKVVTESGSQSLALGDVARFRVSVLGGPPTSFLWLRDGTVIGSEAPVTGERSTRLTIRGVKHSDAGTYAIVVATAAGWVTNTVGTLVILDPTIVSHPAGQVVRYGDSVTLKVGVNSDGPLTYQWWHEGKPLAGETGESLVLPSVQPAQVGNYFVVVKSPFGSATSHLAQVAVNTVVIDTNSGLVANGSNIEEVFSMVSQADGKVIVGGTFSNIGKVASRGLARLNPNGTVDPLFTVTVASSSLVWPDVAVTALAMDRDGRLIVGGSFTSLQGHVLPRSGLGRVRPNGLVDPTFPKMPADGVEQTVQAIAVRPDGRILVGGRFSDRSGKPVRGLEQILADGTVDPSFKGGDDPRFDSVSAMALQEDGKILLGVYSQGDSLNSGLIRLNPDGSPDGDFNHGEWIPANERVWSLALDQNRGIWAGGYFQSIGGVFREGLARFESDGTIDPDHGFFSPTLRRHFTSVHGITPQVDGKVLVAGHIAEVNDQPRSGVCRLNPDGSLDPSFAPWTGHSDFGEYAYVILPQPSGGILVGGSMQLASEGGRSSMVRFVNNEEATEDRVMENPNTAHWIRRGALPELTGVSVDLSADGRTWVDSGPAIRVSDGWQFSASPLPLPGLIRMRGRTSGTAGGFAEALFPIGFSFPQLRVRPASAPSGATSFGVDLFGYPGQTVDIDISTDLIRWSPLTSIHLSGSVAEVTDSTANPEATRFYRAISRP